MMPSFAGIDQAATPLSVSFFDAAIPFSSSAFSDPNVGDTHASTIWQFSTAPDFTENGGFATVSYEVRSTTALKSLSTSLPFATPGATVYAAVQYLDSTGLKGKFSDVKTMTIGPLPTPFVFENFDAIEPYTTPPGWSFTNDTVRQGEDLDPTVATSATYENWAITTVEQLQAFGNTRPVLMSGQCLYAESDKRTDSGNLGQIQYATTPDFNATGKKNVWVSFKSNWVQNQDNIGALEYSVDSGATWLPVTYLLDIADIITGPDGTINGDTTLSRMDPEAPKHSTGTDPDTGEKIWVASAWSDFILARPLSALGPYISGRVNDDQNESKRVERFRLPAADNAAKVRLRFVQAGASSWWWGIDDLGLYEAGGSTPQLTVAINSRTATTMTISWTGGAGKFLIQKKDALSDATWTNYMTSVTPTATLPTTGSVGFYRVQDQYTGPDIAP